MVLFLLVGVVRVNPMTSQRPNQWLPPQGAASGWNQPSAGRGANPQWAAPQQQSWSPYGNAPQSQLPQAQPQQWPSYPAPKTPKPAKKRSFLGMLVIGAFFFLMIPVFIGVVAGILEAGLDTGYPNTSVPGPVQPSPDPAPNPSPPATNTGGYYHEDYQVPTVSSNPPELPSPETYGEAAQWLENNLFYFQDLSVPVRCEMSAINLNTASKGELERHFNELTECLVRVYGPPMERAGFIMVRPRVNVYSNPVQSPCGQMPNANAAYCMADQQIYYSTKLPQILPSGLVNTEFVVESVMAHEFAHSIQGRTGILISEMAWQSRLNESDALELSRRTEVQADCWAGMFNQSVAQSIAFSAADNENVRTMFYNIGDDVLMRDPNYVGNHGHGNSRVNWYDLGFTNRSMGACNSFTASPESVR